MPSTTGATAARQHWLSRVEDTWHGWRERRGRRRGLVPTVIPFVGYGNTEWMRVLGRVVLRKPGSTSGSAPGDRLTNIRGWRSFTSIPVGSVEVEVSAGGERRIIRSDRGGVIDAAIMVRLPAGWNTIRLGVDGVDGDEVDAAVFAVDDGVRFGVVSDIDDTVMVTALPRPLLAAWNTFVLDEHARQPVAGMSVLYTELGHAHAGMPVVYLSTGAWNVAPTLTRFLERNLYPRGALLLTDWGPTLDRWFRSGPKHKAEELERLAAEFPAMSWLLVGDDGQHDESIYSTFAAAHPENVTAIAIRRLTPGQAVLAGGRSEAEAHTADGIPWVYADDGAGLLAQLVELGLLAPTTS
jgi:phosphatidate phosphatase APP1